MKQVSSAITIPAGIALIFGGALLLYVGFLLATGKTTVSNITQEA